MKGYVHPTAIINKNTKISDKVSIGAYSVIGENVTIEDNTVIHSHVVIDGYTKIGFNNQIYPFSQHPSHRKYFPKMEPVEGYILLAISEKNVYDFFARNFYVFF